MIEVIVINETLSLEVVTGRDPYVAVARDGGGLVQVEPCEVRGLVDALCAAAGLLAAAEAARSSRSSARSVERQRLRRRRVGPGPAGDQERGA